MSHGNFVTRGAYEHDLQHWENWPAEQFVGGAAEAGDCAFAGDDIGGGLFDIDGGFFVVAGDEHRDWRAMSRTRRRRGGLRVGDRSVHVVDSEPLGLADVRASPGAWLSNYAIGERDGDGDGGGDGWGGFVCDEYDEGGGADVGGDVQRADVYADGDDWAERRGDGVSRGELRYGADHHGEQ